MRERFQPLKAIRSNALIDHLIRVSGIATPGQPTSAVDGGNGVGYVARLLSETHGAHGATKPTAERCDPIDHHCDKHGGEEAEFQAGEPTAVIHQWNATGQFHETSPHSAKILTNPIFVNLC